MRRSALHRSGVILIALIVAGCNLPAAAQATSPISATTPTPLAMEGESTVAPFIEPYVPEASSTAPGVLTVPRDVEPPADLLPVATAIADAVNRLRLATGVDPLIVDEGLTRLAFARSADMVVRGYLSHDDPTDGSNLPYRLLTDAGYHGLLGENVFASQADFEHLVDEAVDGWLRSAAQRETALNPSFHYTGVGVLSDGEWWKVTQLFAEDLP
jgi:uncharacterized protein YkwD